MPKTIILVTTIITGITGLVTGAILVLTFVPECPPKTLTAPETTIIEVPVEIPIEIPVEVIKEVVREVPTNLRQFESPEELKDWMAQVPKTIVLTANSEGRVLLQGICEDTAIYLQSKAIKDGCLMSVEILGNDEYHKWYGEWLEPGKLHAINSTVIGNDFWFIDFSKGKVWVGAHLD